MIIIIIIVMIIAIIMIIMLIFIIITITITVIEINVFGICEVDPLRLSEMIIKCSILNILLCLVMSSTFMTVI